MMKPPRVAQTMLKLVIANVGIFVHGVSSPLTALVSGHASRALGSRRAAGR